MPKARVMSEARSKPEATIATEDVRAVRWKRTLDTQQ